MARAREAGGASAARARAFLGDSLGALAPCLLPRGCRRRHLIPCRMPVYLGERSSASPELGPRGLGAHHSPNLRETCRLLHSRPPPCEDCPVFPFIRGSPYMWRKQGDLRMSGTWCLFHPTLPPTYLCLDEKW